MKSILKLPQEMSNGRGQLREMLYTQSLDFIRTSLP